MKRTIKKNKVDEAIGKTFGKLTIIERAVGYNSSNKQYVCRCACGKQVLRTYERLRYVVIKNTDSSCGCDIRKSFAGTIYGVSQDKYEDNEKVYVVVKNNVFYQLKNIFEIILAVNLDKQKIHWTYKTEKFHLIDRSKKRYPNVKYIGINQIDINEKKETKVRIYTKNGMYTDVNITLKLPFQYSLDKNISKFMKKEIDINMDLDKILINL